LSTFQKYMLKMYIICYCNLYMH